MAQKPGAERLIAPLAKSASAGLCLALALGVVVLSGCGGGDSSEEQSTSTASTPAQAAAGQSGSTAPGGDKQAAGQAKQGGGDPAAGSGSSGASAPPGKGQKQGPRIAAPKGPTEQAPSPAQIAQATVADMSLKSPAITATAQGPGALPSTYTCDGKDSWPAFEWGGVPAGSAELILYAMNVAPVAGKLFAGWAVAGLDPTLRGIEAGKLPKGAIVGTNGFGQVGYQICPPPGSTEIYMFAIYALPQALSPKRGFDARELRKEILAVSGNVGLLPATYARG